MITFSIIDKATGAVLRTGECDPADIGKQARPGEAPVAGKRLDVGSKVNITQPPSQLIELQRLRIEALERTAADLLKRVAALESAKK